MSEELKRIKKRYGERMMHLCRDLFPTILNEPNRLISILDSTFGHPKYLYDDIVNKDLKESFKNFIYYLYDGEYKKISTNKTPFQLMDDAGYTLVECKTNEDIMQFKKYYGKDEELCTFKDKRLESNYVFFAVKKNVDEIIREHFENPKREDEYGKSVISIQFSRGKVNTLSIKNRYNHTVDNADATFNNNLENIIPGLTDSFEKYYDLNINQSDYDDFDIGYVRANDGKYYKYNLEINGIYYCPDNIIIKNGEVIKDYIDKEKYILIDQFIVNLQNKDKGVIKPIECDDSFADDLNCINKINIKKKNNGTKVLELIRECLEPIYIEIDKYNNIIGYTNPNLLKIKNNFLRYNRTLKKIEIDNVTSIGNNYLKSNKSIQHISLKKVKEIGDCFLHQCSSVKSIDLENVVKIANKFVVFGYNLEYLNAPLLKKVGDEFCNDCIKLKILVLPNVEEVGDYFFANNYLMEYIFMESLKNTGIDFLRDNNNLKSVSFNKLIVLKKGFMRFNKVLEKISLDSVKSIESHCLEYTSVCDLMINNVEDIGYYFMHYNRKLENISADNVRVISNDVLYSNNCIKRISFPNLISLGFGFLDANCILEEVITPNLVDMHADFYDKIECMKRRNSKFKYKIKKKD